MNPRKDETRSQSDEPSSSAGHSEWFYVQRGETYGPVSSTDLRAAAHLGFLGPDDMVRRSDRSNWVTARSVHGLFKNRD
jgi:hypothetical protein